MAGNAVRRFCENDKVLYGIMLIEIEQQIIQRTTALQINIY